MKLEHYKPTYRWVLLEQVLEEKVGSLYVPAHSQKGNTYTVVKVGPQCEIAKPGQRVIVENGPMVDLTFADNRQLYFQVMEPRIIGVEDDSSRDTYTSKSTLPGDSIKQEG